MTVRAFFFREKPFDVTGEAYRAEGEIRAVADDSELPDLHPLLLPLVARNESRLDEGRVICDPMEAALLVLAQKGGVKASVVAASLRRIAEILFDAAHKFVAAFHQENGEMQIFVKGAPDVLLAICTRRLTADGEVTFDASAQHR